MGLLDNPFSMDMVTGGQMNGLSRNLMQMRALRYMHQPYAHVGRAPHQGRPNPLMGGGVDNSPDYSQFTYDPSANAAATQALSPYGLHPLEASQVNPNAILPNSGFFGAHPNLSRMIEGGIFGAANTQGSNTIGEGISNVAQSMISGPQQRNAMLERQFQAPFQQASMLEGMRDKQQKYALNDSEIKYRQAQMDRWTQDKPLHPITPVGATNSSYATYDSEGNPTLHPNPYFDPKQANINASPAQQFFLRKRAELPGGREPTSKELASWQNQWKDVSESPQKPPQQLGITPDGQVINLRPGMTIPPGTRSATNFEEGPIKDTGKKQAWITKQKPSFWLRNGIKLSDPNFSQKAGAFYDNLVGNQNSAPQQAAPAGTPQSAAPQGTGSKFANAYLDYKKNSALKQTAPSNFNSPMGDNMDWMPQPISPIPPVGQIQSPFPR